MCFTAFPVLAAAVFNRPYPRRYANRYPSLYASGQRSLSFNIRRLCVFLAEGVAHSLGEGRGRGERRRGRERERENGDSGDRASTTHGQREKG